MHLLPVMRHILAGWRNLCPFGHRYAFQVRSLRRDPVCANVCQKKAILFVPEHALGQVHRMASALGYAHLQEVEYYEHGIKKTLQYADIGEDKLE
jgi:hypothetical protein